MTALSDLLAEHRPRSSHRCACGWEGDHYDVHLHDVLAAAANRTAVVAGLVEAGVIEQVVDSTVGAPYWWFEGEPFMADEYDTDRPENAVPLYRIGAPS